MRWFHTCAIIPWGFLSLLSFACTTEEAKLAWTVTGGVGLGFQIGCGIATVIYLKRTGAL